MESATHFGIFNHQERRIRIGNLHLKNLVCISSENEMPILAPCHILVKGWMAFNEAMTSHEHEKGVHFFIDDYQFERIWNKPHRYLEVLRKYAFVVSPDFSQYIDMPHAQRIWNNYRGKLIGAWFQSEGLTVVPNVTWSLPDSYGYCFEGIPKHSVIAISSLGVSKFGFSRFLWLKGYEEALKRLQPVSILRHGNKIPGEDESISVYMEDIRLKRIKGNGR